MGVQIQARGWSNHWCEVIIWAFGGVILFSLFSPSLSTILYFPSFFFFFSLSSFSLLYIFCFFLWLYIIARGIYIKTCISFQSSSRWIHSLQQKTHRINFPPLYSGNAHTCVETRHLADMKRKLTSLLYFILLIFFHPPRVSDLATNVLSFFIVIP